MKIKLNSSPLTRALWEEVHASDERRLQKLGLFKWKPRLLSNNVHFIKA